MTHENVLAAKERRALVQAEMRRQHASPVVSITVVFPGAVKYTRDSVSLLYSALNLFRKAATEAGLFIYEERVFHHSTGPEAVIAVMADACHLKKIAVGLEDGLEYGRLLDIDVFSADGSLLSRTQLGTGARRCLVCDRPAVECVRAQEHDGREVLREVAKLVTVFRAELAGDYHPVVYDIGSLAIEAMLMEVACTPSPGLVDRANSGAHRDMDFFTFLKSCSALSGTMLRCTAAGWNHKGPAGELLPILRHIGREGERRMFKATAGVNTQKGLIFVLGVLAAAAAAVANQESSPRCIDGILDYAASMCGGLVASELEPLKENNPKRPLTAGERLYLHHGVQGIRGEMETRMPSLRAAGMPRFQEAILTGLNLNDSLVHALIGLMTVTQDTTIISRHNICVLEEVQKRARYALDLGGMITAQGRAEINAMDKSFISRGISPGGSADLLAATYFLHAISHKA